MAWPSYGYLLVLTASLVGLGVADHRWRLAWFRDRRRTLRVLGSGVLFFLAWDIVGIGLDIFHTNPRYTLGLNLGNPDLPLEEVLLLTLICYLVLLGTRALER